MQKKSQHTAPNSRKRRPKPPPMAQTNKRKAIDNKSNNTDNININLLSASMDPDNYPDQDPTQLNPYSKPPSSKFKMLLANLSAGEETTILVSLMELASELSLAQDSALQSSTAEQFIPPLLACLANGLNPDITLNAMTCLTQIMDLCPNTCSKIASNNGVQCLVDKLVDLTYIDLAESVIKALEKISYENAYSIMTANGLVAMVTTMPFFDQLVQKKILKIVSFTVRSAASLNEYDAFILPMIPSLSPLLTMESKDMIEEISDTIESICNTVFRVISFSPTNIGMLRKVFSRIFCKELVSAILQILTYSINLIEGAISMKSWSSLMTTLLYGAKFSPYVLKECLCNGIIQILSEIMSSHLETSDYAISLIEAMLPKKYLINEADPKEQERFKLESDKEEVWSSYATLNSYLIKNILPKLLVLFEERSVQSSKLYSIQAIIKLMRNASVEELTQVLSQRQFSLTVFIVLDSCDLIYTSLGLELADISLKLGKSYIQHLKREGIEDIMKKLTTKECLASLKDIQQDKLWYFNENPFVKFFCNYAAAKCPTESFAQQSQGIRKYIEIKSTELLNTFLLLDEDKTENELQRAQTIVKLLKENDVSELTIKNMCSVISEITRYELVRSELLEVLSRLLTKPEIKEEESKVCIVPNYKEESIQNVIQRQSRIINGLYSNHTHDNNTLYQLIKLLHSLLYTIDKPSTDYLSVDMHAHFISSAKKIHITIKYCPTTPQELAIATKLKETQKLCPPNLEKMGVFFQQKHMLFQTLDSASMLIDPHRPLLSLKKVLLEKISNNNDIDLLKGKKAYDSFYEILGSLDKSSEAYQKLEQLMKDNPPIDPIENFEAMGSESECNFQLSDASDNSSEIIPPVVTGKRYTLKADSPQKKIIMESVNKASPYKCSYENYDIEFMLNGEVMDSSMSFYDAMNKYITLRPGYPSEFTSIFLFKLIPAKPFVDHQSQADEPIRFANHYSKKLEKLLLDFDNFDFGMPFNDAIRILLILYNLTCKDNCRCYEQVNKVHTTEELYINSKMTLILEKFLENPNLIWSGKYPPWAKYIMESYFPMVAFNIRFQIMKIKYMEKHRLLITHGLLAQMKSKLYVQESDIPKLQRIKVKAIRKGIIENAAKIGSSITNKNALVEFDFANEEGTGLGPTLEFYQCAIQDILCLPGVWKITDNNTYYPAPMLKQNIKQPIQDAFYLLGILSARSIIDERVIDLPLSKLFWDVVTGQIMMLSDIEAMDSVLYKTLYKLKLYKESLYAIENEKALSKEEKVKKIELLKIDGESLVNLSLYFVIPGYDYDLIESGKKILVNNSNIGEYLDKIMDALFNASINIQVDNFRKGFSTILPLKALNLLSSKEIEDFYSSSVEKWTIEYLKDNIKTDHGYNENSPQLEFLKTYMLSLESKRQRLFIQYITGAPRLPIGGLSSLTPKLTIVKKIDKDDNHLPSVMTCQNYLKIPEYKTYEIFKQKFNYAIMEGQGSFALT